MGISKSNTDLYPGSKDWTQKYFHLVEENKIVLSADESLSCFTDDLHLFFIQKGILFGTYNAPIFFKSANTNKWTKDEKIKFLLFESLLNIYLCHSESPFDAVEFTKKVVAFYTTIAPISAKSFLGFSFLIDKSPGAQLESYLDSRGEIKSSIISTNRWINHLENSYIFLDVILFDYYLRENTIVNATDIDNLKFDVLLAVIRTIQVAFEEELSSTEKNTIFNFYLSSSGLSSEKKQLLKHKFETNVRLKDFHPKHLDIKLFRYYLLDIAILMSFFSNDISEKEEKFLIAVADFLQIEEDNYFKAKINVQQFAMRNKDFIPSFTDSTYEKMLSSLSSRWMKILSRNKDKFVSELSESKELLSIVAKATTTTLTDEEKKRATEQFKGVFLKSMPSLAIFMLPGGALLLPLILKIIPAMLPSSFRDNEVIDDE